MVTNELRELAEQCGLYVRYYNAGMNPQYKVSREDRAYHAIGNPIFRARKRAEVEIFLTGYLQAMEYHATSVKGE